jgi:hypothetical protein
MRFAIDGVESLSARVKPQFWQTKTAVQAPKNLNRTAAISNRILQ